MKSSVSPTKKKTIEKQTTVSAEMCIQDLKAVQAANKGMAVTRNSYREHGAYCDHVWEGIFGTFPEFRKQAGLEPSRAEKSLKTHIAKQAELDTYRKFYAEEVQPWCGKYEKPVKGVKRIRTMVVGGDFHDQDSDPFVLAVFLETCKRIQPDIVVLNGDVFDEYEFSKYSQDARQVNIKERYDFVRERIFQPIREACPDAQIDLIIGNHEVRILRHLADKSPNVKTLMDLMGLTLSKLLMLDDFQINLVSKLDLAAYKVTDLRDEIRKNYKKYYNAVIITHEGDDGYGMSSVSGHVHRPKFTTECNEVKGPIFHLTTGCICKVDAEYRETKVNAQNSFAVLHIDTTTDQCVPEHIVFSDAMAVVGGIYYFRTRQQ